VLTTMRSASVFNHLHIDNVAALLLCRCDAVNK
jgi:hypothetical protein